MSTLLIGRFGYSHFLDIKLHLIKVVGKGKVIIKVPTLQYLADFPLRDGLKN